MALLLPKNIEDRIDNIFYLYDKGLRFWDGTWLKCLHKKRKTRCTICCAERFICDIDECTYITIQNDNLRRHKADVHNIDIKWFYCDIDECVFKSKSKCHIKEHKTSIHDIDVKWIYCDIDECIYKCRVNGSLTQHKAQIRCINTKWFNCVIDECDYICKTKGSIKRHHILIHDIGDNVCKNCDEKRYSSFEYKFENYKICKRCYYNFTGRNSRIEERWSDYLDEEPKLKPFCIGSDKSLKKMGGCQSYRPDKLYRGIGITVIGELDEKQHPGENYSCDEKRVSDIYEEVTGDKLIVLRMNPDSYKTPDGSKCKDINVRFKEYKKFLLELIANPPEEIIKVYYMYYSADNNNITKNLPFELIY